MSNQHILTHYDEHLDAATASVLALGRSALGLLDLVARLVNDKDEQWANRIIAECHELSMKQTAALAECQDIIARFHPVANDLRLAVSLVKSAEKLGETVEQLGTLARRGKELASQRETDNAELVQLIGMAATEMKDALQALEHKDKKLAARVKKADKALDRFHRSLLEDIIVNTPKKHALPIDVDRIFFVRAVERVGDTAKGVARSVLDL